MKKRISLLTSITLCLVVAAITFVATSVVQKNDYNSKIDALYQSSGGDTSGIDYSILNEINSYVEKHYYGEIDREQLLKGIYTGYFLGLGDRFSMYHTKEEMDEMALASAGNLVGIGVMVTRNIDSGFAYIRRVFDNSPAKKAGILPGDQIFSVNGERMNDNNYSTVIGLVAGEVGTTLTVGILRDGTETELTVERQTVHGTNVFTEYPAKDIAQIIVTSFEGTVSDDFISAVKNAIANGAKGLVFDMRNNPGGGLDEICQCLDILLPKGPIIRVKDANGNIAYTRDSDESCIDIPMTVLINGSTASAAELFSAALRDYEKAVLIGTKTFGKGTMQHINELSDGSGIRLSVYYYDPPYGDNYNHIGIEPDKTVVLDEYYENRPFLLNATNDAQLISAIEYLNNIFEGAK